MITTIENIQVLGIFFLLSCFSFLLVKLVQAIINGRKTQFRYGIKVFVFLSLFYYAAAPVLDYVKLSEHSTDIKNIAACFWWLNFAFVLDTSLNLYAWDGILSDHGKRHVPRLLTAATTFTLYILAVIIVLHFYYNKPVGVLLTTSGAAAIVVGFSIQSTLKEVFSGLSLNITKALRLGDFVEIKDIYGEVFDMNWRSVSIKNPHTDSLYVFPNSLVASTTILNFSEPTDRFKYFLTFVADPSAPPEKVLRVIAQELEYSRFVRRFPKPDFNILGYTDIGLEIRIRFFFDGDDPWWDAQNELAMAIWGAMKRHKLKLAIKRFYTGNTELEWLTIDNELKTRLNHDVIYKRLKEIPTFNVFDDAQLNSIVKETTLIDYNPPSCFYKFDERSNSLYVVLEGEVNIYTKHGKHEVCIETCVENDMFGLSGFNSGEKRTHMAQAKTYCVALQLDKTLLDDLFADNSKVQEAFKAALESKITNREYKLHEELISLNMKKMAVHKRHIKSELKKYMDHVLPVSWIKHLGNQISTKISNENLLNAIMASSALVCHQRHVIGDLDEGYLERIYQDFNLIKFMDIKHGLSRFHHYLDQMNQNQETGEALALSCVAKVKASTTNAHIVLAVCHGLDLQSSEEEDAINKISHTLGVQHGIEEILNNMYEHRAS